MEVLIARGQNYISSTKVDSIIPAGFLAVDGVFHASNASKLFC